MYQRLLPVTIALIAMTATAAPQAGFGSSPRSHSQEMDHGYGEWIADTERPSEGYRRP